MISITIVLCTLIFGIGLALWAFGGLVSLVAALSERRWAWAAGIAFSSLVLAVPFAMTRRQSEPWLFRMVVGGCVIAVLGIILLLVGLQVTGGFLPVPASQG